MATKYPAKGVVVKYGASAAPTTTIDSKAEVGFEDGDRELIESTTHENTTVRTYMDSGLRDTFAVNLRLFLDPADTIHELLRSHHNAGTLGYLTLVLPDAGAAQWAGSGHIVSYQIEGMTPRNELVVRIRFKFTSLETFTA